MLAGPASAATPSRIADLWYAHNEIIVMLGGAERVAVTVASPEAFPWMFRIAPSLHAARRVAAGSVNVETLLEAQVDLAFVSQEKEAQRLQSFGVQALQVSFTDAKSLLECIRRTAEALDTAQARTRLAEFQDYLDAVRQELARGLADIPANSHPRVLHLASLAPLRADGDGTIIDEWIGLAGGRNAATGLHGNLQTISFEQVAAWNPDIIILGGTAGDTPPGSIWTDLPAVRAGKVFRNPAGVFPWDRYGTEFALQVQWTAKLLHPDKFASLDMQAVTIAFYRRFFNYDMSLSEAGLVLAGQPPP
ncbi:MAG: ABC transporter substrate-binding protein [Janthinobacterium lividum]